jgi:hypothetical protein
MRDLGDESGAREADGMPNVEGRQLVEFLKSDDSALAMAVRRRVLKTSEHAGNYAAFGNAP